jgi:hypothetical protein
MQAIHRRIGVLFGVFLLLLLLAGARSIYLGVVAPATVARSAEIQVHGGSRPGSFGGRESTTLLNATTWLGVPGFFESDPGR